MGSWSPEKPWNANIPDFLRHGPTILFQASIQVTSDPGATGIHQCLHDPPAGEAALSNLGGVNQWVQIMPGLYLIYHNFRGTFVDPTWSYIADYDFCELQSRLMIGG